MGIERDAVTVMRKKYLTYLKKKLAVANASVIGCL